MSTLREDMKHLRDKELGRHNNRKYRDALNVIGKLEKEILAFKAVSIPPSQRIIRPRRGNTSVSQGTVITIASDWHVEEVVKPSQVQGLNKYNPDIAQRRAERYWQKVVQLTERNRSDTVIENLVLILGGDFISGNIHEELMENCALQPVEAILFAQDLIDSGLNYIRKHFKKIVVICKMGNHGRITQKQRHATRNGNSLEYAMYQNLSKRHPDFQWVIEDSYLTYYTIYGKVLRVHHGDAIRYLGGVGGLHIPMTRAYYQWNMTEPADINFMGHYHSYIPGYNTVNGSLIGHNAYAQAGKFSYQPPIQAWMLLDSRRGVTVHSPILV